MGAISTRSRSFTAAGLRRRLRWPFRPGNPQVPARPFAPTRQSVLHGLWFGAVMDPQGPASGSHQVSRGGSWNEYAAMSCRFVFPGHLATAIPSRLPNGKDGGAIQCGWQVQARNSLRQSQTAARDRPRVRARLDVRGTIFRHVKHGNNGESEIGPNGRSLIDFGNARDTEYRHSAKYPGRARTWAPGKSTWIRTRRQLPSNTWLAG